MREMKTGGDLRKTLLETINDIRCHHIAVDEALAIAKCAAQVTASLNAEINANRALSNAGDTSQKLGELPLHNATDNFREVV